MARKLRIPRVLALTATATPEAATDIRRAFRITRADHVQTSFQRTNLHLFVTPSSAAERPARLLHILQGPERLPAIVYVTLQRTAEEIAAFLRGHNLRALPYHAGLADDVRSHAQEAFMCGECEVIVATIAFGMGIDKAGIRCVVHFNLPKTLENYQQETGRAGRDGHASLRAPRALARFLCGITSPAITRDRLTRHDAFGLLSDMAFHDVLDFALREV